MTDLEITRLCAEAMGLEIAEDADPIHYWQGRNPSSFIRYEPLHDDAQAMALLKKFHINSEWKEEDQIWETELWRKSLTGFSADVGKNAELNRAICECVAKMQKGK